MAAFHDGPRLGRSIYGQSPDPQPVLPADTAASKAAIDHITSLETRARARNAGAADDVHRAVIVGGGTIGTAVGFALARIGIATTIIETEGSGPDRAGLMLKRLVADALERGFVSDAQARDIRTSVTIRTGHDGISDADLAIEAVDERLSTKRAVLAMLGSAAPRALLATTTSSLDIDALAAACGRPGALVGLNFSSPAHLTALVEIGIAPSTSPATLSKARGLTARLDKLAVETRAGSIGRRILARQYEIADMVLLDGGLPWEVDEAMVEFGYAIGPYEAQDLAGLDIARDERRRADAARDPARRYVEISDRMVAEGRLGKKAAVGWYRYPGGGGAVIDPLLEDLIVEEAYFAKVKRRHFGHDEVRRRLIAAMIDEAAQILHEGGASTTGDIDLVTVHGNGFPRWRGGLMHHAAAYGFDRVLADMAEFARDDPVIWHPSPGLLALA